MNRACVVWVSVDALKTKILGKVGNCHAIHQAKHWYGCIIRTPIRSLINSCELWVSVWDDGIYCWVGMTSGTHQRSEDSRSLLAFFLEHVLFQHLLLWCQLYRHLQRKHIGVYSPGRCIENLLKELRNKRLLKTLYKWTVATKKRL